MRVNAHHCEYEHCATAACSQQVHASPMLYHEHLSMLAMSAPAWSMLMSGSACLYDNCRSALAAARACALDDQVPHSVLLPG